MFNKQDVRVVLPNKIYMNLKILEIWPQRDIDVKSQANNRAGVYFEKSHLWQTTALLPLELSEPKWRWFTLTLVIFTTLWVNSKSCLMKFVSELLSMMWRDNFTHTEAKNCSGCSIVLFLLCLPKLSCHCKQKTFFLSFSEFNYVVNTLYTVVGLPE